MSTVIEELLRFNKDLKDTVQRSTHSRPAVYAFLHFETGKIYVGSTNDFYNRLRQHFTALSQGTHKNKHLQKAYYKDNRFSISFVLTETKDQATAFEQEAIDLLTPQGKLFNISLDAYVPCKGVQKTEEQKQVLRDYALKQFESPEARERQREIANKQWSNLDNLSKLQSAMKEHNKDPKHAIHTSVKMKEKWSDPKYRNKVTQALQGRKILSVIIDGIKYRSIREASIALNLSGNAIKRRASSSSPIFSNYVFSV